MKARLLVMVLFGCASAVAEDDNIALAMQGVKMLTRSLNDPDSLVIEHVYAKGDHKPGHPTLCISYRAKNAFGGYIRKIAEYKGKLDLDTDTDVLSGCTYVDANPEKAEKKGWLDITDDYRKATPKN